MLFNNIDSSKTKTVTPIFIVIGMLLITGVLALKYK